MSSNVIPMNKRAKIIALLSAPLILTLVLIPIAQKRRQSLIAQEATRALLREADKKQPSVATMKRLVSQGAKVNALDKNGYAPLVLTALHGDLPSSQFLVEHGAQVNIRDKAGYTPLLYTAFAGKTALVKLFLAHGANPNDTAQDGSRRRALSLAVSRNEPLMVAALLARGANPHTKQNMELMGMSTPITALKYILLRPTYYGYENTPYGREQLRNEAQIKQLLLKASAQE